MVFPETALVRQNLHAEELQDIPAAVGTALEAFDLPSATKPGESVAVCVGSRGISQISLIVSECVKHLTNNGLKPFIVPAMGSHGGNTPEGERSVLARLGIDESRVKVPILPTEDVVRIGTLNIGIPILMDKGAAEADHIVVINRVKPHTKFHGPIESGLTKMLTVGLGKGKGAATYHRAAVQHTFSILHDAARHILEACSVLFGLAVLEDGYNNVSQIRAVGPQNWHQAERKLLEDARVMVPRIPFDPIDILVVDEIGKEISGIGMDSNVTGRHRDIVGDFFTPPHVKRIFVRSLSSESDGNANGIGLADVTTQRLVDAIDFEKTYQNARTAISPEKAAVPMHFETDQECVETCLNAIGMVQPEAARIVRIKNTATLETLWISRALEAEATSNTDIQVLGSWEPMRFDREGNLLD